eukprot:TRINITY_DN11129_c0_g1_i1.p1 TRINITY_DN11129_c0_g1~~TRINITY_DN11129_c0_g1_i1.p1  ORF type:complete len:112 (+),score=3.64 TRINITY_DN11129_c0_g1_i1:59-394(+)
MVVQSPRKAIDDILRTVSPKVRSILHPHLYCCACSIASPRRVRHLSARRSSCGRPPFTWHAFTTNWLKDRQYQALWFTMSSVLRGYGDRQEWLVRSAKERRDAAKDPSRPR